MRSDSLILGIDGGGTKTVAWLAACAVGDEPRVIGRGTAGPSNVQAVGFDSAIENLNDAVAAAFDHAGIASAAVAAAVVALAGSDRRESRQEIERWAEGRRLARRLRVVNDALPVLAAGSPDGWGVALVCGTGSFCFGQSRDGRRTRAGGWGYLFGDEGSGYAIAAAGLRAAAKAEDGRAEATELLPAFLRRLRLNQSAELIPAVYRMADDRAAIASLAEVVTATAAKQDAVAEQIVMDAAGELAAMVAAVTRELDFASETFPLVLSGGVLLGFEGLRNRLRARLGSLRLHPSPLASVREPVAGAIKLAQLEAAR